MDGGAKLYRLVSEDALHARPLEGLMLVYYRPSGITHLLDSPLPEIIAALDQKPRTAKGVRDRLMRDFDLGPESEALEGLSGHLDALAALGLVRLVS